LALGGDDGFHSDGRISDGQSGVKPGKELSAANFLGSQAPKVLRGYLTIDKPYVVGKEKSGQG